MEEMVLGIIAVLVTGVVNYFIAKSRLEKQGKDVLKSVDGKARDLKDHITIQVKKANGIPWGFIENNPLPCWAKDKNYKVLWVNSEYEHQWKIRSSQYEGKTDYEIWPKDVADEFRYNDNLVLMNGTLVETIEEIPEKREDGTFSKKIQKWKVIKFPIFNHDKTEVVGIGGIAQKIPGECSPCKVINKE